jgi:hypothetical protein
MSEHLIIDADMPKGYEKLDSIRIYKQKDGSEGFSGIIKLGEKGEIPRTVTNLPEPDEMWGFGTDEWHKTREQFLEDPDKWIMQREITELRQKIRELEASKKPDVSNENTSSGTPNVQPCWKPKIPSSKPRLNSCKKS